MSVISGHVLLTFVSIKFLKRIKQCTLTYIGGPVAFVLVLAYSTYILGPSALLGCFILLFMFPIQVSKRLISSPHIIHFIDYSILI